MIIPYKLNPLGYSPEKTVLPISQWGSQWNDPIIWENIPDYITSANDRKFARHPSGMGTVMSINDGTDRNVLVLDAQYREKGYWGEGIYSRDHYCTNFRYVDLNVNILPFSGWSDSYLKSTYRANIVSNQDIYTSKENTDFMMSVNSSISYYAGFCRSKTLSYNSITVGCDAPNINTLVRIYAEMIKLDELDPTVSRYSGYSLSTWLSGASWSSSLYSASNALMMYSNTDTYGFNFDTGNFDFVPILEL